MWSTRRGAWAVIPRGFHQPQADFREGSRISVTLLREVEEELFGRDDVEDKYPI